MSDVTNTRRSLWRRGAAGRKAGARVPGQEGNDRWGIGQVFIITVSPIRTARRTVAGCSVDWKRLSSTNENAMWSGGERGSQRDAGLSHGPPKTLWRLHNNGHCPGGHARWVLNVGCDAHGEIQHRRSPFRPSATVYKRLVTPSRRIDSTTPHTWSILWVVSGNPRNGMSSS